MAENITVNMENLTDEEREQLLALIKKSNEPACGIWEPKKDDEYWFIDRDGYILSSRWGWSSTEENRFNIGNCFRTEEEAEFEIERIKIIHELKELAGGYKWEYDSYNYYIYFDCYNYKIKIGYVSRVKNTYIYFPTEEAAEKAIDTIGEERLKKYYFGIKE